MKLSQNTRYKLRFWKYVFWVFLFWTAFWLILSSLFRSKTEYQSYVDRYKTTWKGKILKKDVWHHGMKRIHYQIGTEVEILQYASPGLYNYAKAEDTLVKLPCQDSVILIRDGIPSKKYRFGYHNNSVPDIIEESR